MVASQAHRLLLPWKLQAHLDNINYPSHFNQAARRRKPKPKPNISHAKYGCMRGPASRISGERAPLMTAHVVKIHAAYHLSRLFKNDTAVKCDTLQQGFSKSN